MPTTPTSGRSWPTSDGTWASIPTRLPPTPDRATANGSRRSGSAAPRQAGGMTTQVRDPVPELVARSNRLGADPRNTNYAGGNTSAKGSDTDPATGEPIDLMWVKGSGGDLGTLT